MLSISMLSPLASFVELQLQEFGQELLLLLAFFLGWHTWRRVRTFRKTRPTTKAQDVVKVKHHTPCHEPSPSATFSCATTARVLPAPWLKEGEQQIMKHLEEKEFTRAIQLFRKLERRLAAHEKGLNFTIDVVQALLRSGIRVGHFDVVHTLFPAVCRLHDAGESVCDFWFTALKMLAFRKRFDSCLDVYRLFREQLPEDKVVYSCLINAALEVGDVALASSMMTTYKRTELDVADHVVIFRTCLAATDVDGAVEAFKKLTWKTTPLMMNHLLSTCVEAKQPTYAFDLIAEAHAFEKGHTTRIVDVVSYNIVIKGFVQLSKRRECFRCVECMVGMGLQPDDITFNALVEACIADSAFDTANEIVESLRKDGTVDVTTFAVLVKSLIRAGRLTKALHIYQDMKTQINSPPDVVFYSMMIKALVDQSRLDEALNIVADLREAGRAIDDIILTHLLDGCRREARLELGKSLFQEALASGISCSEYSLVMMLKLYGSHRCNEDAYNLLINMKANHGIAPSVAHCTCVASGCFRTNNFDLAWLVCEVLFQNVISLDEMAASTLIQGFANAQQWNRVVVLATWSAKTFPAAVPPRVLHKAIAQLRQYATPSAQDAIRKLEQLALKKPHELGTRLIDDSKMSNADCVPQAFSMSRRAK